MENSLDDLIELLWKIENLKEKLKMQQKVLNGLEDKLEDGIFLNSFFPANQYKNIVQNKLLPLISVFNTQHSYALEWQYDLENMIIKNSPISSSILSNWKTELNRLITQNYMYLQRLHHFHLRMKKLVKQEESSLEGC